MVSASLDVITVPDFLGANAASQAAQALFFLASWLESGGPASGCVLHLACIGEPPQYVRRLAGRAGARITVARSLGLRPGHHLGNKLRGLEIQPETGDFLLLDVDTLVLSDLSPLQVPTGHLAAAPDDFPRVWESEWERIYNAFGMSAPAERMACTHARLGLPTLPRKLLHYDAPRAELAAMRPYFNSGVVRGPWDCNLRNRWEANLRRILHLFDESAAIRLSIHQSDQAALAVSLLQLQAEGWPGRVLEDRFNVRWRHLYADTLPAGEIAILHANTFLLGLTGLAPTGASVHQAMRRYFRHKLTRRFLRLAAAEALCGRPWAAQKRFRSARRMAARLEARVGELWHKHVGPALERRPAGPLACRLASRAPADCASAGAG